MLFDVGFVLIQQLTLGSSPKSCPGGIEAIFHYYHIIFPVYGEKSLKVGGGIVNSCLCFVLDFLLILVLNEMET